MSGSGIHFEWRPWHDWAMAWWAMWQGWLNASALHAHVTGAWFKTSPDIFSVAVFIVTLLAWWWTYDTAVEKSRRKVKTGRAKRRAEARRRKAKQRTHLYER